MNRFVIVDGLPYLYAEGRLFSVRWDDKGFTVGAEVKKASVPSVTHSELAIRAKCAGRLDSITPTAPNETNQVKDLEAMSFVELREYAKAHGVDLTGAKSKQAVLERVRAL